MLIANAPPTLFCLVLNTKTQQRGMRTHRVTQDVISIGRSKLYTLKYRTNGCRIAYAKSAGISQIMNFPASFAIRGS